MTVLTAAAILMRGVAGLPQANDINRCDTKTGPKDPAQSPGNPNDCRTFANPPDPGIDPLCLRLRQALALPIYAAALVLVLLSLFGLLPCFSGRRGRIASACGGWPSWTR